MKQAPKIIVVAGPTASGKSDFAVNLALKNNGEIISADSRQVYKGLDIGTGKITKDEMKGVPHHMLSIYELGEDVSVARYARDASPILKDILSRNKTPIICGGTGQYIDALIFDTSIPRVEPNKKLRDELEKKTTEELYAKLCKYDARRADEIDRHNRVRIIRALEIINELGSVPTQKAPSLMYETDFYIMSPNRELTRERIERRLHTRLNAGMLDECKTLLENGVQHEQLEKLGLEYRYMSRYMRGEISYDEFVKKLRDKICQYAKRQETWNKKYPKNFPRMTTIVKVNNP